MNTKLKKLTAMGLVTIFSAISTLSANAAKTAPVKGTPAVNVKEALTNNEILDIALKAGGGIASLKLVYDAAKVVINAFKTDYNYQILIELKEGESIDATQDTVTVVKETSSKSEDTKLKNMKTKLNEQGIPYLKLSVNSDEVEVEVVKYTNDEGKEKPQKDNTTSKDIKKLIGAKKYTKSCWMVCKDKKVFDRIVNKGETGNIDGLDDKLEDYAKKTDLIGYAKKTELVDYAKDALKEDEFQDELVKVITTKKNEINEALKSE